MHTAVLGVRRLYDALGVDTVPAGEINQKINLSQGVYATVYLGPKPPMGIVHLEGDQKFAVPDRNPEIFRMNGDYKAPTFFEVTIQKQRLITQKELVLLKQKNQGMQAALLKEAETYSDLAGHFLDAVSGAIGLSVHRQLILKPLVENYFIAGDFEALSTYQGSIVEMLESIKTNPNASPYVKQILSAISAKSEDAIKRQGAIFHWLLRAWRESDTVAKFMYLFIPLEAVLPAGGEFPKDVQSSLDLIRELVKKSASSNQADLLAIIERTQTKFRPTLSARFEEYARSSAIPGWELDVQAFRRFNRMRNVLLHAADRKVHPHISIEDETRTLEDLVERYVSIALLGTANVYSSRWRPNRLSVRDKPQ